MKTITDLRNEMLKQIENLSTGEVDVKTADALSNLSGKIIKSADLQLKYNITLDNKKKIRFLDSE